MKKELKQLINLRECHCTNQTTYPFKEKHYTTDCHSVTKSQLFEIKLLLEKANDNISQLLSTTPQCFCQSYYDDNHNLKDCTCGKCGKKSKAKY